MSVSSINSGNDLLNSLWLIQSQNQTAAASSASGSSSSPVQLTPQEQAQLSYNANLMQILNPGTQENSSLVSSLLQNSIDLYQ